MTARKRHVRTSTEQAIAVVQHMGVASVRQVADALGCSTSSARRHLDGGVYRAALICDDHAADGSPLRHTDWRYTMAPGEP
jgi:hypothetical protein